MMTAYVVGLAGIPTVFAGCILNGALGNAGWPLLLLPLAFVIVAGAAFYGHFACRLVWPERITDKYVFLKGVHPSVLDQLPEWLDSPDPSAQALPIDDDPAEHSPEVREAIEMVEQMGGEVMYYDEDCEPRRVLAVSLGSTPATDDTLRSLQPLSHLMLLFLDFTAVTDAGLVHLHEHKYLCRLEVSYTKVTDAGVAELKRALPNCAVIRDTAP